jgi:hypothetical protein
MRVIIHLDLLAVRRSANVPTEPSAESKRRRRERILSEASGNLIAFKGAGAKELRFSFLC